MPVRLRDDSEVIDRRLGRLPLFDERSRQFPIRTLVADKPRRSYTWSVGKWLDQGSEGACVGFAWAHELIARPVANDAINARYAIERIYWPAQQIDPWEGGAYPGAVPHMEGTAVLAGAKVVKAGGHIGEYRWAFGLNDLILALGYTGPAVLGLDWYDGFFDPDATGRIRPTGDILGGHAILAYKVAIPRIDETDPLRKDGQIWLHNSWGNSWGHNGRCWLSFTDMAQLLAQDGEACIPALRRIV